METIIEAKLISADFEESTMEFEVQYDFLVKKGDYVIIPKEDFDEHMNKIRGTVGGCDILDDPGGRYGHLPGFLKVMRSMGGYDEKDMLDFSWWLVNNLHQYSDDERAHYDGEYLRMWRRR